MNRLILFAALTVTCSGCATTTVDRAQGLGDAGKVYVESLKKVNDFALEKSLSFTADVLASGDRSLKTLDENNVLMKERVKLVGVAAEYFSALGSYFDNLDALVKGDQSNATAKAVGDLADTLTNVPFGLNITADRKKAFTGLAGMVAKQFHAAAVEKALVRDADTIAQAIAHADSMLAGEIRWIRFPDESIRSKAYIDEVQTPFLKPSVVLDAKWKAAWIEYTKTSPTIEVLTGAQSASKKMNELWGNVLRGKHSAAETIALLKQLKDGVDALNALK